MLQLVLKSLENPAKGSATILVTHEDQILGQIPDNCSAYFFAFDFRSKLQTKYQPIANALQTMGDERGNNLYVGFWDMADPKFGTVSTDFQLLHFPVIVACSPPGMPNQSKLNGTPFAKMDDPTLLSNTDRTTKLLDALYNYVLQGKIPEAVRTASDSQSLLTHLGLDLKDFAQKLGIQLAKDEIKFSFGSFTLDITPPSK